MIELVMAHLGLRGCVGWVDAVDFENITGPTGSLRRARETMGVRGAFGTWQYGTSALRSRRFVPLLYVAEALHEDAARDEVHRRVWSQGVVPLLIICTPQAIFVSEGYGFSHERWAQCVTKISVEELKNKNESLGLDKLNRLKPQRLMSSLAWRDYAIDPTSRVDRRLLSTLKALSHHVACQSGATYQAVNLMIGRFLYFYILRDRGFLTDAWLNQFGATEIFENRSDALTSEVVWSVFDALDKLLNGTIFPMTIQQRKTFNNHSVRLLRNCIKLGDELHSEGLQLSFFDFDISSLQTETLSAIYEQFLETEDSAAKRRDGVFYTPPYLADFVLDRVEDETPLKPGLRIIDCTSGSGVFVVGAYRRVIEHELATCKRAYLSASKLRNLLLTSIFAIEKNISAHAVTAFSLYLTMLDYVDAKDITKCLDGRGTTPLFPKLQDSNVICADVFAIEPPARARKFDVVIGNPPWQKIEKITDKWNKLREVYRERVDSEEAAEYTLWWATKHLVESGGIVAMVMPTKSLIGPSAKRFPQRLAEEFEIVGIANLSHFRYALFTNARQAACVTILRNTLPSRESFLWVYSPTRAHMPGSTTLHPWTLTLDRSQVQYVRQRDLHARPDAWFEIIMLRPVDRYIWRYLTDSIDVGKIVNLRKLFDREGIEINRGGSPNQTGLKEERLYGADKFKANNIRIAPGILPLKKTEQMTLMFENLETENTNSSWLSEVKPEFHRRFGGSALILPRSMRGIVYATHPIAFNSSLNAIYYLKPSSTFEVHSERARLLTGVGIFLETAVAKYLVALVGKLWILDRTRLEKNDLLDLPVPFKSSSDPFLSEFIQASETERELLLCEKLGLTDWLHDAVVEYADFRDDFKDGGVPRTFSDKPSCLYLEHYKKALSFAVRAISADSEAPLVNISEVSDKVGIFIVSVCLNSKRLNFKPKKYVQAVLNEGVAEFNDSALISTTSDQSWVELQKPAEKFHWTIESAFMDGMQIMHRLMDRAYE